jgi:hypothetical protein
VEEADEADALVEEVLERIVTVVVCVRVGVREIR